MAWRRGVSPCTASGITLYAYTWELVKYCWNRIIFYDFTMFGYKANSWNKVFERRACGMVHQEESITTRSWLAFYNKRCTN